MALPFQSLSAATATGPGAVLDTETVIQYSVIQLTGCSPNASLVHLEGSLDNVNWYQLLAPGYNDGLFTASVPVRYLRANCVVYNSGAATAWIGVVEDMDVP
jgi:hypothetical protein